MSVISQPLKKTKLDVSSEMILASTLDFLQAVEVIRAHLPHDLQDDAFARSATNRVLSLRWTATDFYKWLDVEVERQRIHAELNTRTAEANARLAEASVQVMQITQNAKLVIEPEVCALIEDWFREKYSIVCMYDGCSNVITLVKFYVVRHDNDIFYACCHICYSIKKNDGKPGRPIIALPYRRDTWVHHNGENAFGVCYHCNLAGRKNRVHFYLDTWEAGHDIPRSQDGSDDVSNMAPMHVRCNKNQATKTNKQYHSREPVTTEKNQNENPNRQTLNDDCCSDKLIQNIKDMFDFFTDIKMLNGKFDGRQKKQQLYCSSQLRIKN